MSISCHCLCFNCSKTSNFTSQSTVWQTDHLADKKEATMLLIFDIISSLMQEMCSEKFFHVMLYIIQFEMIKERKDAARSVIYLAPVVKGKSHTRRRELYDYLTLHWYSDDIVAATYSDMKVGLLWRRTNVTAFRRYASNLTVFQFNSVFKHTAETVHALYHWSFVRRNHLRPVATHTQMVSSVENVSMSWHQHVESVMIDSLT